MDSIKIIALIINLNVNLMKFSVAEFKSMASKEHD
jgi:hypothetical protein